MDICIIIPTFNEEDCITGSIKRIGKIMEDSPYNYCIIVSDDGSSDRTVLRILSIKNPKVRVISSKRRRGRGHALTRAISLCNSDYVIYIDADLSINPKVISTIISNLSSFPIVIGSKHIAGSRLSYPPIRVFLSKSYRNLTNFLFGLNFTDYQAGVKGFRTATIKNILRKVKSQKWSWDTEVLVNAKRVKIPIKEIPIEVQEVGNKSSVRLLRDSLLMLLNLIRIRLQ